jgi:hypothetical protein
MAADHCQREAETIRAAWGGPSAAMSEPGLAAHLAECRTCSEIASLARALREDRDATAAEAAPPTAGLVWWRAQRRLREEAARRAARPNTHVHGIALGCAGAATVAGTALLVGPAGKYLADVLGAWSSNPFPASSALEVVAGLPAGVMLLFGATLVLAPIALYLAVSER